MRDPFDAIAHAAEAARLAWLAWLAAEAVGDGVDGLTGAPLVALNAAVSQLRKQVEAVHAQVAAKIARASRAELGNAGLTRQQGFRTPGALIAATMGGTAAGGNRLVAVGEATAPRASLTGEPLPPKYPGVAQALSACRIGVDAAAAIIALLDKVALRLGREGVSEAEALLVAKAAGLPLDQVQKILQRAEAWLDSDGVEPREDELRAGRAVHFREDRSGMIHVSGSFDPETGAPIKTAIESMVGAELRARDDRAGSGGRDGSAGHAPLGEEDRRTIPQLQADALATIRRHVLGCESADVPTAGATVVVRVSLDQLESGAGHATIDGVTQPVSIATARRMAAAGGVLPCVLGGDGEILDFGRARRLFSPAQKLAITERDGGCVGCGLPPGMTQVHHIRWWERDRGLTDLRNGVLLCVRCHHRVHDDGWEIRVDGIGIAARVWLIPPAHVDPSRTPRLGGRARRDYRAA